MKLPADITIRDEGKDHLELQLWERPFDGGENRSWGFVTIVWSLRAFRLGGSKFNSIREYGVVSPDMVGRGWKERLTELAIAHLRESTK